jgi:hypothetical protein
MDRYYPSDYNVNAGPGFTGTTGSVPVNGYTVYNDGGTEVDHEDFMEYEVDPGEHDQSVGEGYNKEDNNGEMVAILPASDDRRYFTNLVPPSDDGKGFNEENRGSSNLENEYNYDKNESALTKNEIKLQNVRDIQGEIVNTSVAILDSEEDYYVEAASKSRIDNVLFFKFATAI